MPLPPVLFEDDALIAFDKPSGLRIASDRWNKTGEKLMDLVHAKMGADVANVHRLDADTSGLVLCAKTYQALVVGLPSFAKASEGGPAQDEFTVDLVIKEDEAKPGRMCVVKKHGET